MRALMVYESMSGHTGDVAAAIAEGLAHRCEIALVEIGAAPIVLPTDLDLLIVGGPTHVLGMGHSDVRFDADGHELNSALSRNPDLREWLAGLPKSPSHMAAAAFDTRVRIRGILGSAARGAARRLRQCGYRLLDKPESFYVTDLNGPLVEGELVRAWAWGHRIGVGLTNGMRGGPTGW